MNRLSEAIDFTAERKIEIVKYKGKNDKNYLERVTYGIGTRL